MDSLKVKKFLFYFLILALFSSFYVIFEFIKIKDSVYFLNVGQSGGVGILEKRNFFLYDAGKDKKIIYELKKILPFWKKQIDGIFLSHFDKDHWKGINEILKIYKIKLAFLPKIDFNNPKERELINILKENKIKIFELKNGSTILAGNSFFVVLNDGYNAKKDNEKSLVIKLIQGENQFLFLADLPLNFLDKIKNFNIKTDYLLVPHHGSKYNISSELLELTNPKIAIIQVGPNPYGHPHKETIDLLNKLNIKFLRTDDGTIGIFKDSIKILK